MRILICLTILCLGFNGTAQEWFDGDCQLNPQITQEVYENEKLRNILTIIIAQDNSVIINDTPHMQLSEIKFKELILEFIDNPSSKKDMAESPKKAIIAMRGFGDNDKFELLQNYTREVYLYLWNTTAKEEFGKDFVDLKCKKRERIFEKFYPYNFFEIAKKSKKQQRFPSRTPGPPPFPSDVKDN